MGTVQKGSTSYTAPDGTYKWAETRDGKTPKGGRNAAPPSDAENSDHSEDGFKLKPPGEKVTYLFRSAATTENDTYIPAGKVFKGKPAAFNRAPAYKAPAVKKGDFCTVDDKVYHSLIAVTGKKPRSIEQSSLTMPAIPKPET